MIELNKIAIFVFFIFSSVASANAEQKSLSFQFGQEVKKMIVMGELSCEEVVQGIKSEAPDEDINRLVLGQVFNVLGENQRVKLSKVNLQDAEQFIAEIRKKDVLVEVVPDKLYYELLAKGSKRQMSGKSALFHLFARSLNGDVYVDTYSSKKPIIQELDEAIAGFVKGVEGMTIGEKRRLYIHPDMGYGQCGLYNPNELLIIDVQVVKG